MTSLTPEEEAYVRRQTGRDADRVLATLDHGKRAALAPAPLDVERLTTVLYDWMPDGADVSLGYNGDAIHLTGADLARFIFDRAAEYERLATDDAS